MPHPTEREGRVVVIGAGPAGLTAAHALAGAGLRPIVLERLDRVGGLARTDEYRGFHFDLGGHRFFTKVPEVRSLWHAILGDEFLRRPRLSRIYYNGKFFRYPLKPWNALAGLGVGQSALVVLSYLKWQLRPYPREDTFEEWVTNRFGRRLFEAFFRTYTEKVWGISCSELRADWAAQRIKDLSLRAAVVNMFLGSGTRIKTLIEEFDYPRRGPGMMWQAVRDAVEGRGGTVRLGAEVVRVRRRGSAVESVVVRDGAGEQAIPGSAFISSMPVTELVARLDPPPPAEVTRAAARLAYRDFVTVCLIVDQPALFPDNWIYVHDPGVKVGRIQNYKNWSPDMVPDPTKTSLGLEYFCSDGDELWSLADADLVELGRREVARIGLARAEDVVDGCVVRVPKAYPVYGPDYAEHLAVVRRFVEGLDNLQTIGRNGLHRYNNQDHAMLTGMLAVRNLLHNERHDLWSVNTDAEYHEEVREPEELDEVLAAVFARLDRVAFGTAVGALGATGLLLASGILILEGGPAVGPHLALLDQYLPGYGATPVGAALGLAYGGLAGFALGWTFALLRNTVALLWATLFRRRLEARYLRRLLDYV
jgi:protoporphyrinogen oxidase